MIEIATVNYHAYRPEMGLAVRTSIGAPRFFTHKPMPCWDAVYPQYHWLKLPYDDYRGRYLAKLDTYGVDNLRADIDTLADICRNESEVQRLCLCCYENLSKPGAWCHRTMLATYLEQHLEVTVTELGALPVELPDPDPTLW